MNGVFGEGDIVPPPQPQYPTINRLRWKLKSDEHFLRLSDAREGGKLDCQQEYQPGDA